MTVAVVDTDFILHAVSCAGETRKVKVIHKVTGREKEVNNRTEWYGRGKGKDGGLLAEINGKEGTDYVWDDFEYEDVQYAEPLSNVLHSAKLMFDGAVKKAGCSQYEAFIGDGKPTFRNDVATILEYKGGRKGLIRPVYLDDVRDYLIKKFKVEVVSQIEADDACVIAAYKQPNKVVVAVDKDAMGCPINVFNPSYPENGTVNCNKFGKLWLNDKGDVKGFGRLFFYYQVAYGDRVDGYLANSATEMRWGEKSAYKVMTGCNNDKEALESIVKVYKELYPEPRIITGWQGGEFEVDWLYVASENWHLARMLRTIGELESKVELKDVLSKMEIL